jgi:hypothetical protein
MPEVSILARGSSLHQTWPKVGVGSITVAINMALVVEPNADWLVMLDANQLAEPKIPLHLQPMVGLSPRYGVMTAERFLPEARQVWPNLVHVGSDRIKRVGYPRMPASILAALWFSSQVLGGTHLHLHGVDLGGPDIDGKYETVERGGRRWPGEAEMLSSVCAALRETGVTVESHGAWKP